MNYVNTMTTTNLWFPRWALLQGQMPNFNIYLQKEQVFDTLDEKHEVLWAYKFAAQGYYERAWIKLEDCSSAEDFLKRISWSGSSTTAQESIRIQSHQITSKESEGWLYEQLKQFQDSNNIPSNTFPEDHPIAVSPGNADIKYKLTIFWIPYTINGKLVKVRINNTTKKASFSFDPKSNHPAAIFVPASAV